jgi:hypothetical protein
MKDLQVLDWTPHQVGARLRYFPDFNISSVKNKINYFKSSRKRNPAVRDHKTTHFSAWKRPETWFSDLSIPYFALRHFLFYFKVKLQHSSSIFKPGDWLMRCGFPCLVVGALCGKCMKMDDPGFTVGLTTKIDNAIELQRRINLQWLGGQSFKHSGTTEQLRVD